MIFADGIEILSKLKKKKLVTDTSVNIAEFLSGFEEDADRKKVVAAVSALLFEWISSGNICITKEVVEKFINDDREIDFPDWEKIKNILSQSRCCTLDPENEQRPIVLADGKIYFYKYWLYEDSLAKKVWGLSKLPGKYAEKSLPITKVFTELFKDQKSEGQKNAAEKAVKNRFSVITGGPGTGKTTTVAKIIAGILSVYPQERIVLAAPTGKAAMRMTESLLSKRTEEDMKGVVEEEIIRKIRSLEGKTIHKILEMKFGKPSKNREDPINADLVIIDEASMVDIAMFSSLLDALSDTTSLILLGDKDQLSSVDAGNVLSDICNAAKDGLFERDIIATLTESHRFDEHPGIERLAHAVNSKEAEADEIIRICKEDPADLGFKELETKKEKKNGEIAEITANAKEKYTFLSDTDLNPAEILGKLNDFKILCPSKEDTFGVENVNREIETALEIDPSDVFYNGRPIMIIKNDYTNGLMNGDCGVILKRNGKTKAWFKQGEDISSFAISELPAFETVYAMTIHKSQGSEYDSVLVLLPERDMSMLTKELLYTAITRARKKVEIVSSKEVLACTLQRSGSRNSGFENALKRLDQSDEL